MDIILRYFPPQFTHRDLMRLDWMLRKVNAVEVEY